MSQTSGYTPAELALIARRKQEYQDYLKKTVAEEEQKKRVAQARAEQARAEQARAEQARAEQEEARIRQNTRRQAEALRARLLSGDTNVPAKRTSEASAGAPAGAPGSGTQSTPGRVFIAPTGDVTLRLPPTRVTGVRPRTNPRVDAPPPPSTGGAIFKPLAPMVHTAPRSDRQAASQNVEIKREPSGPVHTTYDRDLNPVTYAAGDATAIPALEFEPNPTKSLPQRAKKALLRATLQSTPTYWESITEQIKSTGVIPHLATNLDPIEFFPPERTMRPQLGCTLMDDFTMPMNINAYSTINVSVPIGKKAFLVPCIIAQQHPIIVSNKYVLSRRLPDDLLLPYTMPCIRMEDMETLLWAICKALIPIEKNKIRVLGVTPSLVELGKMLLARRADAQGDLTLEELFKHMKTSFLNFLELKIDANHPFSDVLKGYEKNEGKRYKPDGNIVYPQRPQDRTVVPLTHVLLLQEWVYTSIVWTPAARADWLGEDATGDIRDKLYSNGLRYLCASLAEELKRKHALGHVMTLLDGTIIRTEVSHISEDKEGSSNLYINLITRETIDVTKIRPSTSKHMGYFEHLRRFYEDTDNAELLTRFASPTKAEQKGPLYFQARSNERYLKKPQPRTANASVFDRLALSMYLRDNSPSVWMPCTTSFPFFLRNAYQTSILHMFSVFEHFYNWQRNNKTVTEYFEEQAKEEILPSHALLSALARRKVLANPISQQYNPYNTVKKARVVKDDSLSADQTRILCLPYIRSRLVMIPGYSTRFITITPALNENTLKFNVRLLQVVNEYKLVTVIYLLTSKLNTKIGLKNHYGEELTAKQLLDKAGNRIFADPNKHWPVDSGKAGGEEKEIRNIESQDTELKDYDADRDGGVTVFVKLYGRNEHKWYAAQFPPIYGCDGVVAMYFQPDADAKDAEGTARLSTIRLATFDDADGEEEMLELSQHLATYNNTRPENSKADGQWLKIPSHIPKRDVLAYSIAKFLNREDNPEKPVPWDCYSLRMPGPLWSAYRSALNQWLDSCLSWRDSVLGLLRPLQKVYALTEEADEDTTKLGAWEVLYALRIDPGLNSWLN